ncbi:MAG: TetR/AcrR family transcriptional regulator [Stappiaceae bacterium]
MQTSNEKRRQIITAAVGEFQNKGFSGASMDRIADSAGVSKRTVYCHFQSKEGLFRSITDQVVASFNEATDIKYDPDHPFEAQLRKLAWAECRLLMSTEFMSLARMLVGETIRDPEFALEVSQRFDKISFFQSFIEAAHKDGVISVADPKRAATQFLGLIKAQGFWPILPTGKTLSEPEMENIIESSVAMFLAQYGN